MGKTRISWTDMTWPVVTGCSHAGRPGCDSCYAARMAATRLKHHPRYEGLATIENGKARWTGEVRLNHDVLEQPLRWRKPRRVFVASMSDLFHKDVSFDYIGLVLNIIHKTPQHIYQLLTKRAERMRQAMGYYSGRYGILPNVWLGVSVENQAAADERIPWLLQTPAAVRFVSVEPCLSEIDLSRWLGTCMYCDRHGWVSVKHWTTMKTCGLCMEEFNCAASAATNLRREISHLDWIICGGESGPGARPMPTGAASSIIQQCKTAGVPVFMKQLGSVWAKRLGLKSAKGSDMLEWPWDDLKVREYPNVNR